MIGGGSGSRLLRNGNSKTALFRKTLLPRIPERFSQRPMLFYIAQIALAIQPLIPATFNTRQGLRSFALVRNRDLAAMIRVPASPCCR